MPEGYFNVEIAGTAEDTAKNFPITYKESDGKKSSVFYGCTLKVEKDIGSGNTARTFMQIVAFGDVADQLSVVEEGDFVKAKGDYRMKKNPNNGKYYPQVVVTEVIDIEG